MNNGIVIFSANTLEAMLEKGNVWYIRHYELYFSKCYVAYLAGRAAREVKQGNTTLVSLGRGHYFLDVLMAPWRLLSFTKKINVDIFLTNDLIFGWWFSLGLLFKGKRVIVMPVCIPKQIHRAGKSLSGLPIWLEQIFVKLTFLCAGSVVTGKNISKYRNWLSSEYLAKRKLKIIDILVDELPTWEFFAALGKPHIQIKKKSPALLYVGRLHHEKMVGDIIKAFAIIRQRGISACLWLIGDGPELEILKEQARQLGIQEDVEFLGYKNNDELVKYYWSADIFVSTLTGTALREAGLCGLPVVAYKTDWVEELLEDESNALLVTVGDVTGLAEAIVRLLEEHELAASLAKRFHNYAAKVWSKDTVRRALEQMVIEE